MFIENIIYAIMTTVILFVVFRFTKIYRQKIRERNAQIALSYSKTNLSSTSKRILSDSQEKNGYITNSAIKNLKKNIDQEKSDHLIQDFKTMQNKAKETVKNQKFPTCFDHLK